MTYHLIVIYILSFILSYFGIKYNYIRYEQKKNPSLVDLFVVFFPLLNSLMAIVFIAMKIDEIKYYEKIMNMHLVNKFFRIPRR